MAQRDLRRMKRLELLDMMIEQGKQLEQQTKRADELEKRAEKLELQVQASEDRIGHLKKQLADAASTNDRLRAQSRAAREDSAQSAQELKMLRKENIVLATKLDDASRQLQHLSGLNLPSLETSEKDALSSLAKRMESAIERSEAADAERTARLEAILVNQQEIIDDLTARNAPIVAGKHVAASEPEEAPVRERPVEAQEAPAVMPVVPSFRLGPLGKKKKKKNK